MSICNCPAIGVDGIESSEQKHSVADFINQLQGDKHLADAEWSLLSLIDMARAGNDLSTITSAIPFRGGPCNRSMRCCGVCTRRCRHRCIQDCLHRLFMWKKMVDNTPEESQHLIPLNIRLAVRQHFESHEQLSWVVGDILSQSTNSELKEYMKSEGLRPEENPHKIDYSPQVEFDTLSGKRMVDVHSGELRIIPWPESGLCPYCLPNVTVDGRTARSAASRIQQF